MAPLPDNNTGRVWIGYRTGGGTTSQNHELMVRFNTATGGSFAEALTEAAGAITAIGAANFFDGWQATSARYSNAGSTISFPTPLPAALVSFVGTGQATATLQDQARETRFVARSALEGRKYSMSLYGLNGSLFGAADFRVDRGAETFVDSFLSVVEESEAGSWVAIDGSFVVWYQYANWQFNSYWEGELRS